MLKSRDQFMSASYLKMEQTENGFPVARLLENVLKAYCPRKLPLLFCKKFVNTLKFSSYLT